MPWFYDLKETVEENKDNPHFDLNESQSYEVHKAWFFAFFVSLWFDILKGGLKYGKLGMCPNIQDGRGK